MAFEPGGGPRFQMELLKLCVEMLRQFHISLIGLHPNPRSSRLYGYAYIVHLFIGVVYLPTALLSYFGPFLLELEALNRFSARHFVPNGPPVADVVVGEVDGRSCSSVLRRPSIAPLIACIHLFSLLVHVSFILCLTSVSAWFLVSQFSPTLVVF